MSEETRIILVNSVSPNEYITITNDFRKLEKEIVRLNKKLENLEKLNNANYQSFIEVNNIIKEVREEVRIYEEQSKNGITNELDNYVFVQRLKNVLDKGE